MMMMIMISCQQTSLTDYAGCYYRLRQLWRLWRSLDSDSLAALVYAVMNYGLTTATLFLLEHQVQ